MNPENWPGGDLTPDLCDAFPGVQVLAPEFIHFGAVDTFWGPIDTVRCLEDNSKVKQVLNTPGEGRVLVVDGGASMHVALLGDQIAEAAVANRWSGVLINGCVRDCIRLSELPLGVLGLNTHPRKTEKLDRGVIGVELSFAGCVFRPGFWLYADANGVVVSETELDLSQISR
ncbi:MAG: ribonuclease E activity regulator RraA [Gammaproteobacteria bacterium AqS3]|nr:ribonuclease E activity regulator RraA [Gammaproteobacteria bacterium AqS3]